MRLHGLEVVGERLAKGVALDTGCASQQCQLTVYCVVKFVRRVREPFDHSHGDNPHMTASSYI